jgi:hypothetical protein
MTPSDRAAKDYEASARVCANAAEHWRKEGREMRAMADACEVSLAENEGRAAGYAFRANEIRDDAAAEER